MIRKIATEEIPLLKYFLYEAIYLPEGVQPPPKEIVELPELRVYIENFGSRKEDICLVDVQEGKVIGAVWTRIMKDYGHVDDQTPSLAISLNKDYRHKGIGTALMKEMLATLKRNGFACVSLSVQKANYAVRMYMKLGFKVVRENEEEYVMVCNL